jgi:hypothetical protein
VRDELAEVPDDDLWRYTADMLYLLDRPVIRDAFFPTSSPLYAVEPAGADDGAPIAAIADRHEPPAGAELLRAWWDVAPDRFFVARGERSDVAGFSAVCEPTGVSARLIDRDPIAATWRAHLRATPLSRSELALFIRFMRGERQAPDVAPLFLDLKRTYLALRPAVRRVYTCAHDDAMAATLEPLGFITLPVQHSSTVSATAASATTWDRARWTAGSRASPRTMSLRAADRCSSPTSGAFVATTA